MGIPIGTKPGGPVYHPPVRPPKPKPAYIPPAPGEGNLGGGATGGTPVGIPMPSRNLPGFAEGAYPDPAIAANIYQPGAVGALAPVIDQYLARYNSPLAGLGRVFVRRSKKEGIDPRLLVAIAGAESAFGKQVKPGTFNPFGWGPHIPFDSWQQSIGTVAKGLADNYFAEGYNTIPKIQRKWAPSGAANDPTNLNSNWTRNVTKFYNELTKIKPKNAPIPGLAQVIFDPRGSWFNGVSAGPQGGHESHVHVGANNPRVMLAAIRLANQMNLSPRENPYVDPVDPVHTGQSARYGDFLGSGDPSYHYRLFSGRYGPQNRTLGRGLDVSGGSTALLGTYYDRLLNRFAPGYTPGYGGGGYSITGPASQAQAVSYANAAQQAANAGGALLASATSGGPTDASGPGERRKRRKKKDDENIEALIAALQQSAAGAQVINRKGRRSGNPNRV